MQDKPKVSICMITYGHEKYIREAIESVLMQKTSFPIELVLANDCSTDKTDHVIQDILNNHHHSRIIKYIKQPQNIGMIANFIFALNKCDGKFIALCEGDDYWTDPNKLQKQVELMEANPHALICGGLAEIINEQGIIIDSFKPYGYKSGNLNDVKNKNPLITCTIMLKNPFKTIHIPKNISFGDWWLYHDLLQKKESCFLVENTIYARYRKHAGGVTSVLKKVELKQALINQLLQFSKVYSYKLNTNQLILLLNSYYKVFKLKYRSKEYFDATKNLICYCYYSLLIKTRK